VATGQSAWQAIHSELPAALRREPPRGFLASELVDRPACRQLRKNMARRRGGYRPRKPVDVSAALVYVTGQVASSPCAPCQKKHGPWAECVVPPPGASSDNREAVCCANCMYQSQWHKCRFYDDQPQSSPAGSQQIPNINNAALLSDLSVGGAVGQLFYHRLDRMVRATPAQREQIVTSARMDLLAAQVVATGDAGANFLGWAAEEQDAGHSRSYTGRLSQVLSAEDHDNDELDQYDIDLRRGTLRGVGRSDGEDMEDAGGGGEDSGDEYEDEG
jgi:uncharacterized protein DUF3716